MTYYGWIDLVDEGYFAIVKIDEARNEAYVFNIQTKQWVLNNDRLDVKTDTTMWDEIDAALALSEIRRLSGDDSVTL